MRDRQFITTFEQSIYVDDVTSGANNDEEAFQFYEKANEKHPRAFWKFGRVENLIKGQDGNVRGAGIRVHSNTGSRILKRPSQMLYPLEIGCEDVIGEDGGVTVPAAGEP